AGALGPVPYERQTEALRRGRIAVGWDHFHHYAGFYSDRLPISWHSGRPLVNSRQPDLNWLPGPDHGLHLAATPADAVRTVRDLLAADPEALHAAALRGRAWVRERLTDREALLHMLGFLMPLPAPPADPWQAFDRYPVGV
ncbi:glycosyltransferase, partial [Streptomyces sp. T-3]|nr:glycosyltransferase [Streptomyces sp. T-3]